MVQAEPKKVRTIFMNSEDRLDVVVNDRNDYPNPSPNRTRSEVVYCLTTVNGNTEVHLIILMLNKLF
jgi:hypothetical protein